MGGEIKSPETLAERFWSLARGMEGMTDSTEPVAVVEHVLAVLDALDAGKVGADLSAGTVNFLTLLRQREVQGDLLYASPEQARGEPVDERSLVFSVGVLLFEKLTGRHPFGAEGNPQRLARIQRGEMASGVNYFPRVPAELRAVLLKAMGPFPEERWNTLADLRLQLRAFVGYARAPGNGTTQRLSRPLPALPGESLPPPSGRRRAPSPSIELPRMATMSGRHSAVRAEPAAEPPPPADIVSRVRARFARPRLPPGAWAFAGVLAGAAVTSFVFLAAWPDQSATPPAQAHEAIQLAKPADVTAQMPAPDATGPSAPTAVLPVAQAPAPPPVQAAGPAVRAAEPAPQRAGPAPAVRAAEPAPQRAQPAPAVRAAEPATPKRAEPAAPAVRAAEPATPQRAKPAPAVRAAEPATPKRAEPPAAGVGPFDPSTGGENALAAVRACVAADRAAQFGASLLYDAGSGLSRRVYFGAVQQLHAPERHCMEEALIGLSAGAAPARPSIVTYSFHLSPAGDHVKARLKPAP
jgi:hypothetical protein